MKLLIFWSLLGRLDCGSLVWWEGCDACPWSRPPKVKPCMLRSEVLRLDESKTLMVRSDERLLGSDVITMAKRPRGEKRLRFA